MISIISASQAEGGKVVDYAKSYLKTIDEVIARGRYLGIAGSVPDSRVV